MALIGWFHERQGIEGRQVIQAIESQWLRFQRFCWAKGGCDWFPVRGREPFPGSLEAVFTGNGSRSPRRGELSVPIQPHCRSNDNWPWLGLARRFVPIGVGCANYRLDGQIAKLEGGKSCSLGYHEGLWFDVGIHWDEVVHRGADFCCPALRPSGDGLCRGRCFLLALTIFSYAIHFLLSPLDMAFLLGHGHRIVRHGWFGVGCGTRCRSE